MDRRKLDVVFTTALIIISLVILTSNNLVSGGIETDLSSMVVPRSVAVAILFFSAMIGIPSLLGLLRNAPASEVESVSTAGFFGVALYVAILVAYWYLMPQIGFLVSTPLAIFAIGTLLGGRNWVVMSTLSVVLPTLVFYGSSHFLRVFLPVWSLT